MAYSTPAMVRQALTTTSTGTQPSPASGTAADMTDPELNNAIAEADSTIDAYLTARYATPVAQTGTPAATPHPIDYWSRNIAAYLATLTFRGSMDFSDTDPVVRRYKDTMAALREVQGGRMHLLIPANEGTASAVAASSPINPYIGDLWTVDDFSVNGSDHPGLPSGYGPYWRAY